MKFLSTIVAFFLATTAVHAQDYLLNDDDTYMFNHMSLGLSGGTNGVGLDLAMPLGKYVQVRAGVSYFPAVGFTSSLDCVESAKRSIADNGEKSEYQRYQRFVEHEFPGTHPKNIDVKSTPKFLNGKVMFDFYAVPSFPLHLTLGAYFGGEKVLTFENVDSEEALKNQYSGNRSHYTPSEGYSNLEGVKVGNYTLLSNSEGKIDSWIQTSAIRPYVGLGYGKAYSEKGIDWMVEAGAIFWGKPKVYSHTNVEGEYKDVELKEDDLCGNKGQILKFMTKSSIYPVISFRLGFNMF